jgi:hypothetical protein
MVSSFRRGLRVVLMLFPVFIGFFCWWWATVWP